MKKNRGYTLLFSVLVSSIMLAMGVSIVFISRKEIIITGAARESQYAFYAANAGVECAMFHDYFKGSFATSSPATYPTTEVTCNNTDIEVTATTISDTATSPWVGTKYRYEFAFKIDDTATRQSCAISRVDKYKSRTTGQMVTTVEGRGYNLGYRAGTPPDCSNRFPDKVERGIRVTY